MSTESHDKLIRAFQEYFKWQEKFEYGKSDAAGIKARYWLSEIRNFASLRRTEIQDVRQSRKETRKGVIGRPKKVSNIDDDVDLQESDD
jgi:hypothetical protein